MAEENIAEQAATEILLDPFEFQPGIASRVDGLGGQTPGHNPDYALHTRYVEVAEGPARFTARFKGLTASHGTLILRVHRFAQKADAQIVLANTLSVPLDRLAQNGGAVSIRFEGFQDAIYALYGGINGDSDAAAHALVITLDRPADPARRRTVAIEARNTAFGNDRLQPAALIGAVGAATLEAPVCQIASAAQLGGPVAHAWRERLGIADRAPCDQWDLVYVAQVLSAYGMLVAGARGLAFNVGESPLPALMATMNVELVGTYVPREDGLDEGTVRLADLRAAGSCDDAAFARWVTLQPAPLAPLPPDLVNFDFLWSISPVDSRLPAQAIGRLIQDAMTCLRPGGLAVHSVPFDFGGVGMSHLNKQKFDQLTLSLIAGGHEVAQFKIDGEPPLGCAETTPGAAASAGTQTRAGVIVRRARLPG